MRKTKSEEPANIVMVGERRAKQGQAARPRRPESAVREPRGDAGQARGLDVLAPKAFARAG